jgi:UDP-galactopyranose mutase
MAAGRPIASTSLPDVAEPYGDIVLLGDSPDGFVAACERALNEPESDRAARAARARAVLRRTSWDDTARRMDEILRYVADSGPARLEYAAANTGARAAMA